VLRGAAAHALRVGRPNAGGPACVVLGDSGLVVGLESHQWSGDLAGDASHCGRAPVPPQCCCAAWSSRQRRGVLALGHLHGLGPAFPHGSHLLLPSHGSLGGTGQRLDPMCRPRFRLPSPQESRAAEVGVRERPWSTSGGAMAGGHGVARQAALAREGHCANHALLSCPYFCCSTPRQREENAEIRAFSAQTLSMGWLCGSLP